VLGLVLAVPFLFGLFGAVASLIVRFRHARGLERQQLKWFVFAATIGVATIIGGFLLFPAQMSGGGILGNLLFAAAPSGLAVAAAVAILRYRLYDIDIIIRRTLIYSTLILTLGLVYIGCILLSRTLVAPLIGGSEITIVASTLAIAALFNPLRKRIQTIIDKRFYRRKYDAAKVLAAFGTTVRDETDLERLTAEVLRVVDETVQPEFVGLWLRDTPAGSTPNRARPDSLPPR